MICSQNKQTSSLSSPNGSPNRTLTGQPSPTADGQLEYSHTYRKSELVEVAERNHLDIVKVSSTKRRSSGPVDLDGKSKLLYSGADFNMSAPASVGDLTSIRLSDCLSNWISLIFRVGMLKLK